jgi:hypothetical protein
VVYRVEKSKVLMEHKITVKRQICHTKPHNATQCPYCLRLM